ncbi:MAG: hypothetical protein CMD25_08425 [Flavobacteriales bacterium]|nr:hypothetical protein [Flavobacteriales bacterium]
MEEIEKLYSVLTEGGYYTKSFEEFQEQFKDPSYQERVYGVVERDNLFGEKKNDVPDDVTVSPGEDTSLAPPPLEETILDLATALPVEGEDFTIDSLNEEGQNQITQIAQNNNLTPEDLLEQVKQKKIENAQRGVFSMVYNSFLKGDRGIVEGIVEIPSTIYRIGSLISDPVNRALGLPETDLKKFEETIGTRSILEKLQEEQRIRDKEGQLYAKQKNIEQGLLNTLKKGNYKDFFFNLGNVIGESVPFSISMMMGGAGGVGMKKIAATGTAILAGPEMRKQEEDNPTQTKAENVFKGLGMAGAEMVFSTITQGTLGKAYADIIKKEGIKKGSEIFKNGLVRMYYQAVRKTGLVATSAGEGIEEVATQITQNLIDGKPAYENVPDAFIGGMGGGGFFGAPISAKNAVQSVNQAVAQYKVNKILKPTEVNNILDAFKSKETTNLQLELGKIKRAPEILDTELRKKINDGSITEQEANEIKQNLFETQTYEDRISSLGLNEEQKIKTINLLKEKASLEEVIKKVDEASLTTKQQKRIDEINKILNEIEDGAVQKSSTKEIPVQEQPPTSSAVREGDPTRGEPTREGEAKETKTTPREEVQDETEVSETEVEEVTYTLPTDPVEARKDFEVLDNRDGAQGLEIEEDGSGKWVVVNRKTGKIVYSKTKKDAEFLATKDGAANWDYGEGDVIEVETTTIQAESTTPLETEAPQSEVEQERNRLRRQIRNPKTRGLDRRTALVNYINTVKTKGKIAARTARSLIKQANVLNLNNPVTVDRFINRVDKSFQKAESTAQIQKAERLRKQIQKKSKSKTIDGRVTVAAKQFGRVDPLDVESIDLYIEKAEQLLQGMQPTKRTRAGLKVAPAADIAATEKYSSEQIQKQEQRQEQVQREAFELATDISSKDLTLKEIREILEDPTSNNSKKKLEEKEKTTRAGLKKAFNTFSGIVKKQLETGRDAFDAESDSPGKIKYTKEEKRIVNDFMNLNIDNMSTQEAMRALDSLINFTTNGRTGGMLGVVKTQQGVENAKKSPKAPTPKGFMGKLLNVWSEAFASLPSKAELIFGDKNRGRDFLRLSGITDMIRGFDTAESVGRKIMQDYNERFLKKKANNQIFNNLENNVERGMLARVRRTVDGTETEQDTEFRREKKLIEDSITELKNSTDSQEKKMGEVYERVYNRILKDSNNPSEVESKTDKTNLEAVEWFTKEWGKHYKKLSDISLDIYNKPLDKDLNYTHFAYSRLDGKSEKGEIGSPMYTVETSSVYDKESGVLRKRTKPGALPKNKYVNLLFDSSQASGLRKALSDIETAPSIQQVNGFINSASMDKVISDKQRQKIIIDALNEYVNSKRGNEYYDQVKYPLLDQVSDALAKFAVSRTLGSLGQFVKQLAPMASTMVTAGGDMTSKAVNLFMRDNKAREWLKKSGYGIANRGLGAEAIAELNEGVEIAPEGGIKKTLNKLGKIQDFSLRVLLVNADKIAANTSWLAFYGKEMKKQGVDIFAPGFDWSTHKVNRKAGDVAQQEVDRQQNVSDRELQGKAFKQKGTIPKALTRIFLPFASFQMNQKTRLISDLNTLFGNTGATQESKQEAFNSLKGVAAEQAFFHTLGLLFIQMVASLALGEDEKSEEDKWKQFMMRVKGRGTSILTDATPLPPFLDFVPQKAVNKVASIVAGENKKVVFENKFAEDAGIVGIPFKKIETARKLADIAITGDLEMDTGFGKTREKKYNSKQRRNALITLGSYLLYSFGLAPTEIGQWSEYNLRNLERAKSKKKKKGSPFK